MINEAAKKILVPQEDEHSGDEDLEDELLEQFSFAEVGRISKLLNWDDLGELLKEYKSFKSQFPGNSLSKDDFIKLALQSSWGKGKEKEILEQLFRAFDKNKNGTIDFKEFLLGTVMCTAAGITPEEKIKFYFEALDLDNNGVLSYDEITIALDFLVKSKKVKLVDSTKKLTEEIFLFVDADKDNKITSKELCDFMHQSPHKFQELGLGLIFDITQ